MCVLIILNDNHLTTDVLVNKMYLKEPFGIYNPKRSKCVLFLAFLSVYLCLQWSAIAYFSLCIPIGFAL